MALIIVRLIWLRLSPAPALPGVFTDKERKLVKALQGSLYLLMLLMTLPRLRIQPGMIGKRGHPPVVQPGRRVIRAFPGPRIHNPRFTRMLGVYKLMELLFIALFQFDPVADIGTIKAGNELFGAYGFGVNDIVGEQKIIV